MRATNGEQVATQAVAVLADAEGLTGWTRLVLDEPVPTPTVAKKQKWVKIRHGKRDGYVLEEHVRSPVEQAACFVKVGNTWKMTGFAPAGGE